MDTRAGLKMTQLRDWQRDALQQWRSMNRRAVIEAVTGSGKTEVGIAAVAEAVRLSLIHI